MPHFITLMNWTKAGVKNSRTASTAPRARARHFKSKGIDLTDVYWTIGQYDLVCVLEAPDIETLAAALLALGGPGSLRTTTLRGFTMDEMKDVIAKAG